MAAKTKTDMEEKKMKKILAALTVIAAATLTGTAFAQGGMGPGMGAGAGMGPGCKTGVAAGQYSEQYKKFAQETLPIRQEMMNKHFDLQKEYLKDKPDQEVIKKLQGEIGELRKKMIDAHVKSGLPMGKKMGKMNQRGNRGPRGGMMGGMMQDCPWMTAPPAPAPTK